MRKITAKELIDILQIDCGEQGAKQGEEPDYGSYYRSWWFDGTAYPQQLADAINEFFSRPE